MLPEDILTNMKIGETLRGNDLKIFQSYHLSEIVRVMGGWIFVFTQNGVSAVFIPEKNDYGKRI